MTRRRFTERQVIETLIRQGAEIRCYRTKELVTLENVCTLEREHIHELALGGADDPANCAYSFSEAHKIVTFGNGATTAGSSANRIAKTRGTRADKFLVSKKPLDIPREARRGFGGRIVK